MFIGQVVADKRGRLYLQADSEYSEYTSGDCSLAESLRSYRKHLGMSQKELAEYLQFGWEGKDWAKTMSKKNAQSMAGWGYDFWTGLSQALISQLENGKRSFFSAVRDTEGLNGNNDRSPMTWADVLDYELGLAWRKKSVPVKAHNRIRR